MSQSNHSYLCVDKRYPMSLRHQEMGEGLEMMKYKCVETVSWFGIYSLNKNDTLITRYFFDMSCIRAAVILLIFIA